MGILIGINDYPKVELNVRMNDMEQLPQKYSNVEEFPKPRSMKQ